MDYLLPFYVPARLARRHDLLEGFVPNDADPNDIVVIPKIQIPKGHIYGMLYFCELESVDFETTLFPIDGPNGKTFHIDYIADLFINADVTNAQFSIGQQKFTYKGGPLYLFLTPMEKFHFVTNEEHPEGVKVIYRLVKTDNRKKTMEYSGLVPLYDSINSLAYHCGSCIVSNIADIQNYGGVAPVRIYPF